MSSLWAWVGFTIFIVAMLAIDLGVLNRKAHVIRLREAAIFTTLVVACAAVFNGWIFVAEGTQPGLEFLTGYLIELALSVDNIFVFILVFSYFQVPAQFQHRVLFWGIIGALAMRGGMIAAGWLLVERFDWIIYIFGAFLVYTGIRMATHDEVDIKIEANPVLRLIRRLMPVSPSYDGQRFFTKLPVADRMRWFATPLFVVLVMVDVVDLIFAVDSIPAIFAITADPFIIFTSNVFAILGLRSMYFLLAGIIEKFHYLKLGLAAVLTFVGVKMLITYFETEIPIGISLGVVGGVLGLSVVASMLFPKKGSPVTVVEEDTGVVVPPREDDR
jgi:tellurite resistance protein TerC